MDDHNDVSLLPLTPPKTSSAEATHDASSPNETSDTDSLHSFNFDFPATDIPREGALFTSCIPPPSSRMPESIRNLGIFLNKKRRAQKNAMRGSATAWLDQDDSGTYDPKRKRATPDEQPRKKAKKQKRSLPVSDGNGRLKARRGDGKVEDSLVVRLTLGSEKGVQYLRSIAGPDGEEPSSSDSSDSDHDSGYGSFPKPRRRKRPDRLGAPDLAVGHPQRRGCKACFEAGDDGCSLIGDVSSFPCEACRDAGVECELILQPVLKGVCERCKRKRRRGDAGRGVDSCDLCEEGDAEERERMWVACNQCRGAGKRCSNKGKTDWGPCSGCRKSNEECKFVLPSQRQAWEAAEPSLSLPIRHKKRNGKASRGSRCRSETPEGRRLGSGGEFPTPTRNSQTLLNEVAARERRRSRKKGPHHILKVTSFCHPITFNYEPDPMGKNPCSFCDYPTFGICGLQEATGPRTVEGYYVPASDGGGFEEIHGGYSEAGYTPTKMCINCTFSRLRIVGCRSHRVRKLVHGVDVDPRVWDEEAWDASCRAIQDQDWEGARLVYEARYCSVCPDLAHFACCAKSFALDGELGEGCGLLLCERCKDMMGHCFKAGISGGSESLDAVIGEAGRAKLLYPNGVRADAEFLTSDGELMVRVGQGMGSDVDDEGGKVEVKPRTLDKGKGKDMSYFTSPRIDKGKEKQTPRVWIGDFSGGGWMDETKAQMQRSVGTKLEVGVAKVMAGGAVKMERKAIRFGEEIRAGGKAKELSRWWDKDKGGSGEVEVIELSDDED